MPKRKAAATDEQSTSENFYKKRLRSYQHDIPEEECKNYSYKKPCPQYFSLPSKLIYYIARNPINVQRHLNLMKSCKLLFRMSRIIPVKEVTDINKKDGTMEAVLKNRRNDRKRIHFNDYVCQFWIFDELRICLGSQKFASELVGRIYTCSLQKLILGHQVLTFNELQILVDGGKLKDINFDKNIVKYDNGSIVEFEKVFKALFCKEMYISLSTEQHGVGKETATKISDFLKSKGKYYTIELLNIPESFDFQTFKHFLTDNITKRMYNKVDLVFADTISAGYKHQLELFIDEVIQIPKIGCWTVPIIEFVDQDMQYFAKLQKIRYYDPRRFRRHLS